MIKRLRWLTALSEYYSWLGICAAVIIITGIVGLIISKSFHPTLVAFGLIFFFFLPGLPLTFLLFQEDDPWLFRAGLSLVIGLSIEPTVLFFASRFGFPISFTGALIVALLLAVVGYVLHVLFGRQNRHVITK